MIDKRKILNELKNLKSGYPEDAVENKLLAGFMEYITKQPQISERECLFRLRIRRAVGVLERRRFI